MRRRIVKITILVQPRKVVVRSAVVLFVVFRAVADLVELTQLHQGFMWHVRILRWIDKAIELIHGDQVNIGIRKVELCVPSALIGTPIKYRLSNVSNNANHGHVGGGTKAS